MAFLSISSCILRSRSFSDCITNAALTASGAVFYIIAYDGRKRKPINVLICGYFYALTTGTHISLYVLSGSSAGGAYISIL